MNYLVHAYLSDPDPLCRLGNLMGDFVKGRLVADEFPPRVLNGLRQHRAVDRIAQGHPAVQRSKARLDDRFGHTKSILVDIFYDHLLAKHWARWETGALTEFTGAIYHILETHEHLLVDAFRPVVARMIARDWLGQYQYPEAIEQTLAKISRRFKRSNPLAEGYRELARCGDAMVADFDDFLQSAQVALTREVTGRCGDSPDAQ